MQKIDCFVDTRCIATKCVLQERENAASARHRKPRSVLSAVLSLRRGVANVRKQQCLPYSRVANHWILGRQNLFDFEQAAFSEGNMVSGLDGKGISLSQYFQWVRGREGSTPVSFPPCECSFFRFS